MWRSIKSIKSSDNKSNRSKDEVVFQQFGSRIKENQPEKKAQRPEKKFLHQYLSKKKTPDGASKRTYSQKNIENYSYVPSPASLHDVNVKQTNGKQISNKNIQKEEASQMSLGEVVSNHSMKFIKNATPKQTINRLSKQLKIIRNDQMNLQKSVQNEFQSFAKRMKDIETQFTNRIAKIEEEVTNKQSEKGGINPQIVEKIKRESSKLSERIQQIQNCKLEMRQKYRLLHK